jgi:uncharacterized membrane protein
MTVVDDRPQTRQLGIVEMWDRIHRAFNEFLFLPTCIILLFLLTAVGSYLLDHTEAVRGAPVHTFLKAHFFADAKATSDLLGAIAGSIITMTSLTITLLLIVVQQSAASMTAQVFDQFLRRRQNQFYFGFFVGLALYALITLATVDDPYNPIYGAGVALLLTIFALYFLIVLIYTTINQMRPAVIIESIHDHILFARHRQLDLIRATRRSQVYAGTHSAPVMATRTGFVTRFNVEKVNEAAAGMRDRIEVVMNVSIGSYVAYGDCLAIVKAATPAIASAVVEIVRGAVHIEQQRDVRIDPSYGIEQMEMIAWTSISTAKSNPAPGLLAIQSLRDIIARWATEPPIQESEDNCVVYSDDVIQHIMDTIETLAVVSSESMQHQIFAEVACTLAAMLHRLPLDQQRRSEDVVLRILPALGDLVLTRGLDEALSSLAQALEESGYAESASAVRTAHEQLRRSVGKLNSRATRVTAAVERQGEMTR